MRKYLIILFFTVLGCNSKTEKSAENKVITNCNDKWNFESSKVTEKEVNDSVTQEIVDGKVWFEIISPKDNGNGITKAYIKNYRMDGSLHSEGWAEYLEHPVADYTEIGMWKLYDCNGKFKRKNYH